MSDPNLPPGVRVSDIPGWRPEDDPVRCRECNADEQFQGDECSECGAHVPTAAELAEDAADAAADAAYDRAIEDEIAERGEH